MNVKAHHGAIYFITLIYDYSRYGYVHVLSHRYQALNLFKCFVAEVKTQVDRGCEYLLDMFKEFCKRKCTRWQLTIHHTPQQNSIVERRN